MITKERLLASLDELVNVEEGMVTLYANFAKALLKETPKLEEEKREHIRKSLSILYRDSTMHKEILDEIAERVRKNTKNEY